LAASLHESGEFRLSPRGHQDARRGNDYRRDGAGCEKFGRSGHCAVAVRGTGRS
jgi:hypothetical protein